MKLSDEEFKSICTKISHETFEIMKDKILNELKYNKECENKNIDADTIINVILCSLGLINSNFFGICKKLSKDINLDKMLQVHQEIIKKFFNDIPRKESIN